VPTIDPCSLQLLHVAAHVDAIESQIKPALGDGEWVVLDRYWWSTYVYGLDTGIRESQLRLMINVETNAWETVKPDIIFLVDSDNPLRDDEANSVAWQRKRRAYKRLADEDIKQRCVRLETGKNTYVKDRALSQIRESIAALTVSGK
jgi:thymidylate kinase